KVGMARETSPGQWQLMEVGAAAGKIKLPPANYRLYSCQLLVTTAQGEPLTAQGMLRTTKPPLSFKAGSANSLNCGAPLQVKLGADKRKPESWELSQLPGKANPGVDSDFILAINATVSGQGGEIYSNYGRGKGLREEPSKPAFTIANAKGEKIAKGNLEFG
ncbi:MAG TPA: hypothetical protein VNT26_17535, partial [Candidatus Sulfotelmatobacter sp.]|nr:hypothetical protein [Candidatus Sulfotelmatobacter sp.]